MSPGDPLMAAPVNYRLVGDAYPKMTAFQTMMLFSDGAPLTPAGGSSCSLKNKLRGKKSHDTEQSGDFIYKGFTS